MKILHVTKKYPPALGGDAVVVSALEKQQRELGHSVVIATSNIIQAANNPLVYKIGLTDTATALDSITLRRIMSLFLLAFRMFSIAKAERPDIIHTHSVDMAFFASFAARRYKIPLVHTFHIVTFYDKSQPAVRRLSELWLARRARPRTITVPNSYDVKRLQDAGLKQTRLLPNAVDLDYWNVKKTRKKSQRFTFVSFGRLEKQKGYEYLLLAAARLMHIGGQKFRVIIAGDGSQEKPLRNLIHSLDIQDIVTLDGRKNPKEIRDLLANADAAVFPSLYETTPVSLLEAWATRTPVVSTAVGILRRKSIETPETAFIVPPGDDQRLMLAMRRCIRDESRRESIAYQGYEEVQKYTWPKVTDRAESIYRGAM